MKLLFRIFLINLLTLTTIAPNTIAQTIGGVGASLVLDTAKDGGFTLPRVKGVVPFSPAYAQDIKEGWYILRVNDFDCKNKSLEEVVSNIRGEVGTPVRLSLADNPQGKKAKTYIFNRATIQTGTPPPPQPPTDPTTAFYDWCGQQTVQIRRQGHNIVKKFNSECGNYFFSFEAEELPFHVRLMTMEDKGSGTYNKGFDPTASIYDNNNEAGAVPLKATAAHELGNSIITELEGTITLKRNSVGVVSVKITPLADAAKCKGMYIVVYK